MIFDSHAHYDDPKFNDRIKLLDSFPTKKISGVINVGTDLESSVKSVELAQRYSFVRAAIGIHPQNLCKNFIFDLEKIYQIDKNNVVAIGEIGLDYSGDCKDFETQKEIFKEQIVFAKDLNLPVIIHTRVASKDTIKILETFRPRGVVHCFSGDFEFAQRILNLGLMIGIGGIITFKNSKNLMNVIKEIPIESILLETDAPYLAPEPHRGKRCDSTYIWHTAEKLARIQNISIESVIDITEQNAVNFFGIIQN